MSSFLNWLLVTCSLRGYFIWFDILIWFVKLCFMAENMFYFGEYLRELEECVYAAIAGWSISQLVQVDHDVQVNYNLTDFSTCWICLICQSPTAFSASSSLLFGHTAEGGILVPWPGIKPTPLTVELQNLNCWTTAEAPVL